MENIKVLELLVKDIEQEIANLHKVIATKDIEIRFLREELENQVVGKQKPSTRVKVSQDMKMARLAKELEKVKDLEQSPESYKDRPVYKSKDGLLFYLTDTGNRIYLKREPAVPSVR